MDTNQFAAIEDALHSTTTTLYDVLRKDKEQDARTVLFDLLESIEQARNGLRDFWIRRAMYGSESATTISTK
ncbi:hypothetical protein Cenrod_1982 [Candidatus Symbiobacter mobilis CR]|uniref:Uncharacterized protein n=1 Tax=Candidatus Symbiobacter mobilis CR TaxID=946483 RepID=U5N9R1_9BURK|nr:hypothetical protein Cenrod_1982 [Candidatus Symbiobacter mobilis CR]